SDGSPGFTRRRRRHDHPAGSAVRPVGVEDEWTMLQLGQHEPAEALGLLAVRIPRQDERIDPELDVALELGPHLVGVAHDRGPAAAPGAPDAGPQMIFDEPVTAGRVAKLGLAAYPDRRTVERPLPDLATDLVVETTD